LTTNGDDRPELHVHESQAGDQLPAVVDDDKKGGQAGDQPRQYDADVSNPNIDAPDVVVEEDNNVSQDSPELHVHEGQAGDQLPEVVEDENNDRDVPFDDNKNVDGDNNVNGDIVEDDDNDSNGAVPLAPNIPPQFNPKDLYKVLGVPMNTTERQIKILYRQKSTILITNPII
jgi:hypothetical protein